MASSPRLFALSAALILVAACASGPPPPDWLGGASSKHPEARFVIGVGSSTTDAGAAELALQAVAASTAGTIDGARIDETWTDPETGTHWALAVLERAPLVTELTAELSRLDGRIAEALTAAETRPPDESLSSLATAVSLVPKRDRLREQIAGLGGSLPMSDADARVRASELEARLATVKRQLRIDVSSYEVDAKSGNGEPNEENRRALAQKILELGFSVGQSEIAWGDDPVWLRVDAKVAMERVRLLPTDRFVAVHWSASVEITDTTDFDVVAILTDEGRATHVSETEARRIANREASRFSTDALEQWLNTRITSAHSP